MSAPGHRPADVPARGHDDDPDTDTVVFGLRRHPVKPMRVAGYGVVAVAVGLLTGLVWYLVVDLPAYTVNADGTAATTVAGLTEIFAGDAWFTLIGLLAGIALGVLAWRWFGRAGWQIVPIAVLGAVLAALVCWWTGWMLGPGPLDERLVAAGPGDVVPVELTVRARVAIVAWVLGAMLSVLVRASLGPDPEEPRPLVNPWRRRRSRRR